MVADTLGKSLHDRATRGETLSDEEQLQLENWYDQQDSFEGKLLDRPSQEDSTTRLQAQVEAALTQLTVISKRIQEFRDYGLTKPIHWLN